MCIAQPMLCCTQHLGKPIVTLLNIRVTTLQPPTHLTICFFMGSNLRSTILKCLHPHSCNCCVSFSCTSRARSSACLCSKLGMHGVAPSRFTVWPSRSTATRVGTGSTDAARWTQTSNSYSGSDSSNGTAPVEEQPCHMLQAQARAGQPACSFLECSCCSSV